MTPEERQQLEQLKREVAAMKAQLAILIFSDRYLISRDLQFMDGRNIQLATGTGTRIGTAAGQRLGFFNASPVAQQSAITNAPAGGTGSAAGGWDTAANRDSAITTINNILTTLRNLGLIAS